jgi:hypothetical protein
METIMDIRRHAPLQFVVHLALVLAACLVPSMATADGPVLLGDLDSLSPEKLSREQLQQLMTGAKMRRTSLATGSATNWTNEPDGVFVMATDNRSGVGVTSLAGAVTGASASGTWRISPDGRYCVTVEWTKVPREDWCRHIFRTTGGYYGAKSDQDKTGKVYRLWINGQ